MTESNEAPTADLAVTITWTKNRFSETGRVGGFNLFTVGYGGKRQQNMYYLATSLPVKGPAIGQHYPTATHAKVAAEQVLRTFIDRLIPPVQGGAQ